MTTQQNDTQEIERPPAIGEAGFTPAEHSDDAELAAIEAQLAANGGQERDDATEEQEQATEPTQPQSQEVPAAAGKPAMVPHSRFHEVNLRAQQEADRNRALELQLAEMKGMVAALAAGKTPAAAAPQQAEPTPQERLVALEDEFASLAEKYERGELSTKDYEIAKLGVSRQINRVEREIEAPASAASPTQDTYLQEQTDALTSEFPVLATLTAADIDAIIPLARRNAAREGADLGSDLKLRRYVAATAQGIYGGPQTTTANAGGKPPARPTNPAANGLSKLEIARRAPPNLNGLASQGPAPNGGEPTKEQFDGMTEDQRAALPDAVLARMASAAR